MSGTTYARPRRRKKHRTKRANVETDLDYQPTTGVYVFRVGMELANVNTSMWGSHWIQKHRETVDWQWLLTAAIARFNNRAEAFQLRPVQRAARAPKARMRVTITRYVPSIRNFMKDYENRIFAAKPVYDALKRAGLIYDDSERWVERVGPVQAVSPDGRYWTEIRIEPVRAETRQSL